MGGFGVPGSGVLGTTVVFFVSLNVDTKVLKILLQGPSSFPRAADPLDVDDQRGVGCGAGQRQADQRGEAASVVK